MSLARRTPMRRTPTRTRPPRTDPNERTTRTVVRERSLGCCEMCGQPATDMHHRVNRSQGGQWTPGNILHLCAGCHHHVTVNPRWATQRGYTVGGTYTPNDIPLTRWSRWTGQPETVLLDDRGGITHTDRTPGIG